VDIRSVFGEGAAAVGEVGGVKVKFGNATRAVPLEEMAGTGPMEREPRIGDLVAAEIVKLGRNKKIENRSGVMLDIFEDDVIVGAFGNRYATDQFEGYVPEGIVEEFDMLSVGGVVGELRSRHVDMAEPTKLRALGYVVDADGRPVNGQHYGLAPVVGGEGRDGGKKPERIFVVGSAMNSGKTTTAGTIARSLTRAGYKVAAAKITGTAAGKDGRFFEACGAWPVLDFTAAGYPSTYMLPLGDLLKIHDALISNLEAEGPDYVVVEIADGIFQRETHMLLDSDAVRLGADHVIFAAVDSLSAAYGASFISGKGLPLRATSGVVSGSPLAKTEAEAATDVPCLALDEMINGKLLEALGARRLRSDYLPEEGEAHEPAAAEPAADEDLADESAIDAGHVGEKSVR